MIRPTTSTFESGGVSAPLPMEAVVVEDAQTKPDSGRKKMERHFPAEWVHNFPWLRYEA